ncbi:MAG: cupin domain-containing protein [Planctomycetota bacterium]|nr:cupin domain-containing protein [Planctomycetota bacterium]
MTEQSSVSHHRWDAMPKEKVTDAIDRRLVTGERSMLAHVYLAADSVVPRHSHDHEQFSYILQGALHFWIGEDESEEVIVRAGEVLHIPSNVPHKAKALEDTIDLDVFTPVRQDWLDGTDTYFHDES